MATDQRPQPTQPELEGLRDWLQEVPAAVYWPPTGRVFICPGTATLTHRCEREFTLAQAVEFAAHLRAAAADPIPDDQGPIVLVYGVPWAW